MLSALISGLLLQGVPALPPRPSYWQQEVRYDIAARLDEPRGVLEGRQRVVYLNRSPDTLTSFSLHLYLNAFRPGSRWSDADSVERRRRFNDLKDPDYGFNHVRDVRIMGRPVEPVWPLAPDSTIVRFPLPAPLAPGDSMVVEMTWDARPSTVLRRQGRRGRRFDFAQWYPRVVAYDRHGWNEHALYPAGEFYGEFGSFLVQLDLPDDQVIGATGVALCGDPGWARANQRPDDAIQYRRDYYPAGARIFAPGDRCGTRLDGGVDLPIEAGRKKLVWYADPVHHFAMSLNPDYRYEGGWWGDVAVHVLYQPGDETSWGGGVAVQRTQTALAWLDGFFGPFGWPQITNVHRIDGGGTEFPMMVHDGSASQGLIVHEVGHNYLMGLLANNEWREGWLDEGFSEFQGSLFSEAQGQDGGASGTEAYLTGLDLDGTSEPASLIGEDYRDFASYQTAIYSRGELFFHRLRYLVGDETLLRIMRTYYARWKFHHVDEDAFRAVAEEVSGRDLSGFFAQGLHATPLVDYAVGRVRTAAAEGGWGTRVEVIRKGEGRLPVEVWVFAKGDTAVVRSEGQAAREWVTVATRTKPREVRLDPRVQTGDWNMLDNRRRLGFAPFGSRLVDHHFDTFFSTRRHRDQLTSAWLPTVWYNDAGGITLGLRSREDYFARFEQNVTLMSRSTGWQSDRDVKDSDFLVRIRNPVWLRRPGLSQTIEGYNVEGRFGAKLAVERTRREHAFYGPEQRTGLTLEWLQPDDLRYLAPGYYDDAGTVELRLDHGATDRVGQWNLAARLSAAGGLAYSRRGLTQAVGRADVDPFYGRFTLEATARRPVGRHASLNTRLFGGLLTGDRGAVKQRQLYLAGADPLQQFGNPFLRSTGALLVRPDINYHAAGGGNLRGFAPTLSADGLVAMNLELERRVRTRRGQGLFRSLSLAAFGDGALARHGDPLRGGTLPHWLGDAGVGVRAEHRIGETLVTTRLDLPLVVSRPALAQDSHPGNVAGGFRWLFSFQPAW